MLRGSTWHRPTLAQGVLPCTPLSQYCPPPSQVFVLLAPYNMLLAPCSLHLSPCTLHVSPCLHAALPPVWGDCHRKLGHNVVLREPQEDCFRCIRLELRSPNILQVCPPSWPSLPPSLPPCLPARCTPAPWRSATPGKPGPWSSAPPTGRSGPTPWPAQYSTVSKHTPVAEMPIVI